MVARQTLKMMRKWHLLPGSALYLGACENIAALVGRFHLRKIMFTANNILVTQGYGTETRMSVKHNFG